MIELSPKQFLILRFLAGYPKPATFQDIEAFLKRNEMPCGQSALTATLKSLRERELVEASQPLNSRYFLYLIAASGHAAIEECFAFYNRDKIII